MKLDDAIKECERWFAYNERVKQKSIDVQKIASDVRNKVITSDEARRKLRNLDNCSVTVFDGAKLEEAVKLLLKHIKKNI